MMKRRSRILFIMAFIIVLFIFIVCLHCFFKMKPRVNGSFVSENGQTYTYCEYSNVSTYLIDGVVAETASRQQILGAFDNDIVPATAFGDILSAEQAARYGVAILNETFENWTYHNHVGVIFNKNADIWFVHGQVRDRNSNNKIGVIVFDAATAEILGIGLFKP